MVEWLMKLIHKHIIYFVIFNNKLFALCLTFRWILDRTSHRGGSIKQENAFWYNIALCTRCVGIDVAEN